MAATVLEQAGQPVSLAITTPALTISDITSFRVIKDPELITHKGGTQRTKLYLEGDEISGIEIETTDIAKAVQLPKGILVKTAVLTVQCTKASNSATTRSTKTLKMTITVGTVTSDPHPSGDASGSPGKCTIRIETCQDPEAGIEGTATVAFAAP